MKISKEFDAIIGFAREEAMRTGSYTIEADHLLLGILRHGDNGAVQALRKRGIDTGECKSELDSAIFHEHCIPYSNEDDIRLGREGGNAVSLAIADSMAEGAAETSAIHLLKAILKQEQSISSAYLRRKGMRPEFLSSEHIGKPASKQAFPGKNELAALLSTFTIRTDKTITS